MRWLAVIISIICCLAFPAKSQAQYISINFDRSTIAEMGIISAAHYIPEKSSNKYITKILNSYIGAEIAMAGIYDNKKKDRRALERPGLFSDAENWYFKLACSYAQRIMVKVINVAYALLDHPEAILQWGPYIYDTITSTRDLCKQFSAVVTNGKLSFDTANIIWLAIGDDLVELFQLVRLANYDWKGLIDNLTSDLDNLSKEITMDDVKEGLKAIVSNGQNVANAGLELMMDFINEGTEAGKKLSPKPKQLIKGVKEIYNLYQTISNPSDVKAMFLGKLGLSEPLNKEAALKKIFKIKNFDISDMITDYVQQETGKYYTQMWYIKKKIDKTETVCEYAPGEPSYSSAEWTKFDNCLADKPFSLSPGDAEIVLQNSEGNAGWSRKKCNSLNTDPDVVYKFSADLCKAKVKKDVYGFFFKGEIWAAAYHIKVTKETHKTTTVYGARLDTKNEDAAVFEANMKAKMESYKMSDTEDYEYYIEKDSPNYYDTADPAKLELSTTVTFTAHCSDGGNMGEGNFSWKVNPSFRYSNLNSKDARDRAIELAMETNVSEASLDTTEIHNKIVAAEDSVTYLNKQKKQLENENNKLYAKIAKNEMQGSQTDSYRNQISANNEKIADIEKEIEKVKQNLSNYYKAKDELLNDYYDQDDITRIPSQMRKLEEMYQLTWIEEGQWNGLTYTRKATMRGSSNSSYILTFVAELKQTRKESRFLGVRYHRAILQVDWKLDAHMESENIVDVMDIKESWDSETKEKNVNRRLEELKKLYPDCSIKIEYNIPPEEEEKDEDVIHLLWPNERLEIEREVVARLNTIYSRLLLVEKFIYQTRTLKEWLRMDLDVPRPVKRGNKADSCYRKWYDRSKVQIVSSKYKN